jgi:NCS1 family nucleobase:cation symporter-1
LALVALVLGIAPCVPGFLATVSESWKTYFTPADPTAWSWTDLYPYAWFISFGISFVAYIMLMVITGKRIESKW